MQKKKKKEENDRMGKTRDFFKKIIDSKRIFHAKMGITNNRSDMGLIETEDIKNKWQEFTENLYKKKKKSS